jgi:hypothetical protein
MDSNYKSDQKLKRQLKRNLVAKHNKLKGGYHRTRVAYERPKKQDLLYNLD